MWSNAYWLIVKVIFEKIKNDDLILTDCFPLSVITMQYSIGVIFLKDATIRSTILLYMLMKDPTIQEIFVISTLMSQFLPKCLSKGNNYRLLLHVGMNDQWWFAHKGGGMIVEDRPRLYSLEDQTCLLLWSSLCLHMTGIS